MNYSCSATLIGVLSICIITLYPFFCDLKIPFWSAKKSLDFSQDRNLYRGLYGLQEEYDLIIVGAGLSGSVIAEQASSRYH